ncbi:hypothetical protein UFOVP858_35 [uncultured Caudovirales phage]|uniref:Uncharacterized protein n=1 Tax=uncultured Caudovirales phage TaxID=2100421 RepID=A0A6J5P6P6_9CAUD|nr:hypothetical protein UFOVP858_35 [uncultured Caudovirales phage]
MEQKHCPHCKRDLPFASFHKDKRTSSGLRCWCKECCSWKFQHQFMGTEAYQKRLRRYYENRRAVVAVDPKPQWVTYAMSNAKRRSKEIGVEYSLTREEITAVFPDMCPLLGTPFVFSQGKTLPESPSLDRKDSSKGYTPDNIWVISAKANRIKSDATTDEITMVADNLRKAGV